MVGTVRTRQTHYEVLGLEPTATKDEIAQAFAREIGMFRPHSFAGAADATVAFQTLRDPARRRAYDASLGLAPKPEPRPAPMSWRVGAQFLSASTMPTMRPTISPPTPPEAPAEPEERPFIAAALRELARPEPLIETLRSKPSNSAPVAPKTVREEASERQSLDDDRQVYLALSDGQVEGQDGAIPWKQTGIVAGAVIAAVALLGAWAGWDSARGAEPAENVAQAVLPPPTTYTVKDPAAAAPNWLLDDPQSPPPQKHSASRVAPRVARVRPASRLADLDRQLAAPTAEQAKLSEQAATIAPATAVAATLPLPNRVVVRTIERIGYPCGQIASTTDGGAPGVFKVTCMSGHSYQAAPVRGRYHFRRLAGG